MSKRTLKTEATTAHCFPKTPSSPHFLGMRSPHSLGMRSQEHSVITVTFSPSSSNEGEQARPCSGKFELQQPI